MAWLPCPYLGTDVELTAERERHIAQRHPDLLPSFATELEATIREPDLVGITPASPDQRAFIREWPGVRIVVIVKTDASEPGATLRSWRVTAHLARRLGRWRIEWQRG